MSSRNNLTWELTEPPTILMYAYISNLFSLRGPKLFLEDWRQKTSQETLRGNRSVKMGSPAWASPGGKEAMLCLRHKFTITSPASWVRVTRGKQWITPKVLENCSQNMELRRNHIPLWFRLNAVKVRRMYFIPTGSAGPGHRNSKAQRF